jgi:prepilin-type N-terminal cleavage/methylation domain-containing protein
MKTPSHPRRARAGFTLVEILTSMSIVTLALTLALSTFLTGLRMMYKDNVRLQTNADLRYFMAQMSKETLDSSEFYIFPSYQELDGGVILTSKPAGAATPSTGTDGAIAALETDTYGMNIAHGDCVVLVTRTSVTNGAAVRQFRIYYRVATVANRNNEAPIRYYESDDYGLASTQTDLEALLNAVNLNATPTSSFTSGGVVHCRQITPRAKGRRIGSTNNFHPIFSSEAPTITATNESFSINVEFISGTSVTNMLSSSSFNYTVSPRR